MRPRVAWAVAAAVVAGALLARRRFYAREPRGFRRPPFHGERAAVLTGATLFVASLPVLAHEAARQRDPGLFWTLVAAEQVRLASALMWHEVAEIVYAPGKDVDDYDAAARAIAERLRGGRLRGTLALAQTFPWDTRRPTPTGTNFVRLLNGAVYAVVGPSKRAGFLVFAWLAFWGVFLFYRAFMLAVPDGHARTYAGLVFFLPSLVFWTSTVGKEAWMLFSLGIAALGVARMVSASGRGGVGLALLGSGLAALVRPHVPGMLSRRESLDETSERTFIGGSRFTPPVIRRPTDVWRVAGTVLFRPHAFEAHNRQALAAALEATLLLLLTLARIRWALATVVRIPRRPYVGFAIASASGLIAALSRHANFGLLSRQRVPIIPFYAVLLSIPPRRPRRRGRLRELKRRSDSRLRLSSG